jgi:plasmid stabilization system protein ParE
VNAYVVAPDAESDLQQIWRYLLGEAGLAGANRIQAELVEAFESAPAAFNRPRGELGIVDQRIYSLRDSLLRIFSLSRDDEQVWLRTVL